MTVNRSPAKVVSVATVAGRMDKMSKAMIEWPVVRETDVNREQKQSLSLSLPMLRLPGEAGTKSAAAVTCFSCYFAFLQVEGSFEDLHSLSSSSSEFKFSSNPLLSKYSFQQNFDLFPNPFLCCRETNAVVNTLQYFILMFSILMQIKPMKSSFLSSLLPLLFQSHIFYIVVWCLLKFFVHLNCFSLSFIHVKYTFLLSYENVLMFRRQHLLPKHPPSFTLSPYKVLGLRWKETKVLKEGIRL